MTPFLIVLTSLVIGYILLSAYGHKRKMKRIRQIRLQMHAVERSVTLTTTEKHKRLMELRREINKQ